MACLKVKVTIPLQRRLQDYLPGEPKFSRWEDAGTRTAEIELSVDMEKLVNRLGERALRSKGGRAVEANGLVVARVVGRVQEDEKPHAHSARCYKTPAGGQPILCCGIK